MAVVEPLQQEREVFAHNREQLLAKHEGDFALIHGDQLLGVYDTYADALRVGYDKCGLEDFMVKRIEATDKVHLVYRGCVECQ